VLNNLLFKPGKIAKLIELTRLELLIAPTIEPTALELKPVVLTNGTIGKAIGWALLSGELEDL
jgi:hypothetical protein